jgi:phenylalanine-4-hydroxylase
MSEMSSLPETPQLKDVAVELERLQGRVEWGAWAIVASGDALFGMSRMFQVFAERNFPVSRVFRDLGEARSWLASVALDAE